MKKIFTILLGVIIALSATAAHQVSLGRTKEVKDVAAIQQHVKHIVKAQAKADGEVINIEANNLSIDASMLDLYLEYVGYGYVGVTGSNDDWEVEASLYPEDANYFTTYSSAADDIEITLWDSEETEIAVSVSAAELKQTAKGNQFTATCADGEGNTYNINLTLFAPDEPKATTTLDFGVASVKYYADTKDYYIYGKREDYLVSLDIFTQDLVGEYTASDFDTEYTHLFKINTDTETGKKDTVSVGNFYSLNAKITLSGDKYTIAADMFATDSVLYHVTMTYIKPVATDTIYYTFVKPIELNLFEDGDYYGTTTEDPYLLQLDFYADQLPGTYSTLNGDFYEKYTGLFLISEDKKDTVYTAFENVKLTITENETDYDLKVVYFASDLHCYIFTLKSEKATAKETVQVNLEDAQYTELPGAYGQYYGFYHYVVAAPADSSYVIALAIKNETLVGTHTQEDLNIGYSGVQVGKEYYQIAEAEFTASAGESGSYTLQGWLLAKNNVKYEFVIKTAKEETAVENAEVAQKAVKCIENGQLIIEKNGKLYNVLGTVVK